MKTQEAYRPRRIRSVRDPDLGLPQSSSGGTPVPTGEGGYPVLGYPPWSGSVTGPGTPQKDMGPETRVPPKKGNISKHMVYILYILNSIHIKLNSEYYLTGNIWLTFNTAMLN